MTERHEDSDDALRRALDRLRADSIGDAVSVETIAALADGSYTGPDRVELLDRVLADPRLAQEFEFLRGLAREGPARPSRAGRRPVLRWWPVAAAAAVVLAVGIRTNRDSGQSPDTVRSATDGIQLVSPSNGSRLADGLQLAWSSVDRSSSYDVEIVDATGRVIARTSGPDTTFTFRTQESLGAGRYDVSIVAHLSDGTERRSAGQFLSVRPE